MTLVRVRWAIGMDSFREPESLLKPPPWTLIKTRACLSGGTPSAGVTTQTGMPAIVDEVMLTGYTARFALAPAAAAASVSVRL